MPRTKNLEATKMYTDLLRNSTVKADPFTIHTTYRRARRPVLRTLVSKYANTSDKLSDEAQTLIRRINALRLQGEAPLEASTTISKVHEFSYSIVGSKRHCKKCHGYGFPQYWYYYRGVCFSCNAPPLYGAPSGLFNDSY